MEENKSFKEELVEKAKALAENNDIKNKFKEIADLRKKWNRNRSEEESFFDKELEDKFESYLAKVEQAQKALAANAKEAKEAIIQEAKKVQESEKFKEATAKMNDLFEQFKAAGHSSNKEEDDELWEKFKEIKDGFYEKKNEYYAKLKETFAANKVSKEALIEKAKEALEIVNLQEASKKFDELMAEWKKTGNAGKECNDDLWNSFQEVRKAFFKKKNEYYEHMKEEYAKRTEAKKELIARAKKYLANSSFTEEEVNAVKALRNEWKEIGSAGKENENELWKDFSAIMDRYFDNKKYYG